jgi:hypothetical protein
MTATVKESNPNWAKDLMMNIDALDNMEVKVGWFESAQYPDGTPVAYAAAINEYGSPKNSIPARPFMRPTASENETKWKETAAKIATRILEGKMTAEQGAENIGAQVKGDILDKMASITAPPLSPITLGARKYRREGKEVTGATIGEIARKLKDGTLDISGVPNKPLYDTGVMINTLTYDVVKK